MAELTVSVAKAIAGGQGATWWEVYQLALHFLRQHGEDAPPFSYPAAAPPADLTIAHPSRGVVDEAMVERACRAHWDWWDEHGDTDIKQGRFAQMRAALQAAALPAVPLEESAFMMLRAFSDATVDAAMTGIGIVKLTGDAGVITATCVPPDSITLAAAPAQEVAGG